MIESHVTIEYFQGERVVSMAVPREELPEIAGCTTFWIPFVLQNDEMERRGRSLKERIGKTLFTNAVLLPPK